MRTIFFTGFPGFLGSELVPRVLARAADLVAVCLVQPKFAPLARQRAQSIMAASASFRDRIRIVEGDITLPDLGLGAAAELTPHVTEIFHLAAVYDLSVERELAMRVNVEGTRHLLDFAAACPALERFQYVSTCYVSGRYGGVFHEHDLEKGQSFHNHYEETKYLAEVLVQERMRAGLRATIYRPAIVTGDSRTGATQKYDGPFYILQWLLRQPRVAILPVIGDPRTTYANVVPRDAVVDAISYLSALPAAEGRVYQLADAEALTADEAINVMARATRRRIVRLPLPLRVAKGSIDRVPGVYRLMRIPSAAIDYFAHPARYDTTQAQRDLEGSGIRIPSFAQYAERLVEFMRHHPEIGAAAMA